MRIVASKQEALYRGYRIEGTKEGACIILFVMPTRRDMPSLEYSRFRSLPKSTWPKAVEVVCDYIDQALGHRPSPLRSLPLLRARSKNSLPKFRARKCIELAGDATPDPKECRRYAKDCRWLASEAVSVWGRHTLIHIADRWDQLALELESAEPSTEPASAVILPLKRTPR
jgi:hypothetical protein